MRQTRLRALAHQRTNGGAERSAERVRLDGRNVGSLKASEGRSGEVIVAARLRRGPPLAEAGQRERMIAHGANVMLGLPDTPTLDARRFPPRAGRHPVVVPPPSRPQLSVVVPAFNEARHGDSVEFAASAAGAAA